MTRRTNALLALLGSLFLTSARTTTAELATPDRLALHDRGWSRFSLSRNGPGRGAAVAARLHRNLAVVANAHARARSDLSRDCARSSRHWSFQYSRRRPGHETAAQRIHALLETLGVSRVRVVGHDIGMMVAFAYAALYPEQVPQLVAMDARMLPGIGDWQDTYHQPDSGTSSSMARRPRS